MNYYGRSMHGFGAFGLGAFDSASVWAKWKMQGAEGQAAAKEVQTRLNELGFANPPLTVDGDFKSKSMVAYCLMLDKNGQPHDLDGQKCWPGPKGLSYLDAGASVPGPNPTKMCQTPTGESVPCSGQNLAAPPAPGPEKAGMSTASMLVIGVLVVGGIAALALMAKKKKPEGSTAVANRRRRARRNGRRGVKRLKIGGKRGAEALAKARAKGRKGVISATTFYHHKNQKH